MIGVAEKLPGVRMPGPGFFARLIAVARPRVYNISLSFGDLDSLPS
jgi:hypothetical protein